MKVEHFGKIILCDKDILVLENAMDIISKFAREMEKYDVDDNELRNDLEMAIGVMYSLIDNPIITFEGN